METGKTFSGNFSERRARQLAAEGINDDLTKEGADNQPEDNPSERALGAVKAMFAAARETNIRGQEEDTMFNYGEQLEMFAQRLKDEGRMESDINEAIFEALSAHPALCAMIWRKTGIYITPAQKPQYPELNV